MLLSSIFIHQITRSTIVLCIYKILEERIKAPLNIPLIDVDSAYYQEVKPVKFIHLLINYGDTKQGPLNRVVNGRPRDVSRTRIWNYSTQYITAVSFSILLHQMCCVKYLKFSFCIFIHFWRTVLWTSSKHPKKTSIG